MNYEKNNCNFKLSKNKKVFPKEGLSSEIAYKELHEQLKLDGDPSLNLASFVTTEMDYYADKLIMENIGKNFINICEYPKTYKIERMCVQILSDLYNSPNSDEATGTSTVGSSEAILLALLAHKWTWKKERIAQGRSYSKPNIVMGADAHTVWKKFALYFDVEIRLIPMEEEKYTISAKDIIELVDENTICVGTVLGTTYTGQMDSIQEINDELLKIKDEKGWNIPIHVDAASGGFIAPFVYPDLQWDFRLEQVRSINVSGHKFGLVYPGIAWLLFKNKKDLPEDLIFNINYLSGERVPNYSLNFSKNSSTVIVQYYNFIKYGFDGYAKIMMNMIQNMKYLIDSLIKLDALDLIEEKPLFPVITLKLKDSSKFSVYNISSKLKEKEWVVPAYTLPKNAEHLEVLRIVIKENFNKNMIDIFVDDLKDVLVELNKS